MYQVGVHLVVDWLASEHEFLIQTSYRVRLHSFPPKSKPGVHFTRFLIRGPITLHAEETQSTMYGGIRPARIHLINTTYLCGLMEVNPFGPWCEALV